MPGLGVRRRAARARGAVVGAIVLVLLLTQAGIGRADTANDLDAARQKLSDTQAAASAVAAEVSDAEGRVETLADSIAQLRSQVTETKRHERALVKVVKSRARIAYTRAADVHVGVVLEASGPLQAARRSQFLDLANEKDHKAVKRLAALRADLRSQQAQLRTQREEAAAETKRLDASFGAIQNRLADAVKARDDLIGKLEAERAAAARLAAEEAASRAAAVAAELAHLRAAQPVAQPAAQQSPAAPSPPPTSGGPGQIIGNPGGGSFQCPVTGSAYTDSYGPRGSGFHYGIDMFAPMGTPLVAVKAGSVRFVPNEGDGGNTVYLSADDGNVYFYAHLSSFVGGARSVAQGEVVGLVGMTGNATGPHLHFEIRIGGANGQRIDPYPTLRAAGC